MMFNWGFLLGKRARRSSSLLQTNPVTPDVRSQRDGNDGKGPGMSPQGEEAVIAWLRGEGESSLTGLIKKQEASPRNVARKLAPAPRGGDQVRQWLSCNSPDALKNVLSVRDRCSMEAESLKGPLGNPFGPSRNGFGDPYAPLSYIDEDHDWKIGVDCPEDDAHLPVSPLESKYLSLAMPCPSSGSSSSRGSAQDEGQSRRSTPFLDLYRSRSTSIDSRPSRDVNSEPGEASASRDRDNVVILPLASATIERATRLDMPSRSHAHEPADSDSSSSSTDVQAVFEISANEKTESNKESEDTGHILPIVVGQPMRAQEIEVNSEDETQSPQLSDTDLPKRDAQAEPLEEGEGGETQVAWSPNSMNSDEEKDGEEGFGFMIMVTPASPPESRMDMEHLEFHDPNVISIIPANPKKLGTDEDEGCEYDSSSDDNSGTDSPDGDEDFDEDEEWMGDWNILQERLEKMSEREAQQAIPGLASELIERPASPTPPEVPTTRGRSVQRYRPPLVNSCADSQRLPVLLDSFEAAPYLDMIRRYLSLPDTTTPQQIQGSLGRNPEILRASMAGLVCNPAFTSQTGFEVHASKYGLRAPSDVINAIFAVDWERNDDPSGGLLSHILHFCEPAGRRGRRSRKHPVLESLIKLDPAERQRKGRATWAQRCRLLPKLSVKQIVSIADESSLVRSGLFEQFIELVELGFITTDAGELEKPGFVLETMSIKPPPGSEAGRRRIQYPKPSKLCQVTAASDGDGHESVEDGLIGQTQHDGAVARKRTTLEIALSTPRL